MENNMPVIDERGPEPDPPEWTDEGNCMSDYSRAWKRAAKRWRRRALYFLVRIAQESESAQKERRNLVLMCSLLDECLHLVGLLFAGQQAGEPMGEGEYQAAMAALDRIKQRFGELKAGWRIE